MLIPLRGTVVPGRQIDQGPLSRVMSDCFLPASSRSLHFARFLIRDVESALAGAGRRYCLRPTGSLNNFSDLKTDGRFTAHSR